MKSAKFLDDLIDKESIKNDSALAIRLDVAQNSISQYRTGKRIMDNETCLKIAVALDIDPLKIIMAADIDRAHKAGKVSAWEMYLVNNKLTDVPLHSAANQLVKVNAEPDEIYIMSN